MLIKSISNTILALLLLISNNVFAVDTYNHLNNQLTIPAVEANGFIYKDVVVTVGQILNVGGIVAPSKLINKVDKFNSSTNQLHISNVLAYGTIYNDVIITIGEIIYVKSFAKTSDYFDGWQLSNITTAGRIEIDKFAPIKEGHFDLLAVGDLNNDGYEDLVLGPKVITSSGTDFQFVKLVIAFYNPNTKLFNPDPQLQKRMPSMQFSHKAVISDFNKDGVNDLLVLGTGPDQGQPCGEASVLLLGSSSGLVDSSYLLPRKSAYTHQIAIGDFTNDSYLDIYMLNNPWIPDSAAAKTYCETYIKYPSTIDQFLISSKNWMTTTPTYSDPILGDVLGAPYGGYTSATSGDFDNDGNLDLVVYGENGIRSYVIIMFGDGKGSFNRSTRLQVKPFSGNNVSASMSAKDLDGDGIPELIINNSEQTLQMGWQGSAFSVLKYEKKSNTLADVTQRYFEKNIFRSADSDVVFCNALIWRDLNNDGIDDLICSVMTTFRFNDTQSSPRVFIMKSNGKFEPVFHRGFDAIGKLGSLMPIRIDGSIKLVGITNEGCTEFCIKGNEPTIINIQLVD